MFRTLLSIVLLLSVSVAIQAQQPVNVLTRAEVDALLARPADVLVIDVRRPDEIGVDRRLPGLSERASR